MQDILLCFRILIFTLILAALHLNLLGLIPFEIKIEEFYTIHLFNFSLIVASNLIIAYVSRLKNNFGFAFLGMSVFKMLLIMVYLGVIIIKNPNVENFALHFVFIYFTYLFYDVLMAIKTLNNKN